MNLQPYTLVEFGRHGEKKRLERFLRAFPERGESYFILAEGSKAMPHPVRSVEVDYALEHGMARIVEDDYLVSSLRHEHSLGRRELRRLEISWHIIRPLVAEDGILEAKRRGELIGVATTRDRQVEFTGLSFTMFERLVQKLSSPGPDACHYEMSVMLWSQVNAEKHLEILGTSKTDNKRQLLAEEFNKIIAGPCLYSEDRFSRIELGLPTRELLEVRWLSDDERVRLNRLLLQDVYPFELARCGNVFTKVTLYANLRKFWQRGGVKAALQLDYGNRQGNREKKGRELAKDQPTLTTGNFKKWGAKGKWKQGRGVNVTKADQKNFRAVIRAHYHGQRHRITFRELHERLWDEHYTVEIDLQNGGKERMRLPEDKVPTIHQLRYFYETKWDLPKRTELREGTVTMQKKFRAVPGDQTLRYEGPGFEYQIDSTIADIHLVDESRRFLLGRPTMYLVVDTFSTLIVGVHITFENAQYSQASEAIWNAFEDKVAFCFRLGINISCDEWPSRGLPHAILADRGEILGKKFNQVVTALNLRVGNTPPYRADIKGIVERNFKKLNEHQIQWLWGAIPDEDYNPQAGDYRKEARLTLKEFTKAIVLKILDINKTPRKDHHLRKVLREAGVPRVPTEIWKWGMKNSTAALRTASPNYVRLALLPADKAVITPKGIKFRDLVFLPQDEVAAGKLLSEARISSVADVVIRYHAHSVNQIYTLGDRFGELTPCKLSGQFKDYNSLSWREWGAVKDARHIDTDAEAQRRGQTRQKTNELKNDAKVKGEQALDGDTLNTKQVQQQRESAIQQQGKEHATQISSIHIPALSESPESSQTDEVSANEKDMFEAADAYFRQTS